MLYVVVSIVSKRNGRRNGRPSEWQTLLVWQGGTDQELNMFMGLNGAISWCVCWAALPPHTPVRNVKIPKGKPVRSFQGSPQRTLTRFMKP